MPQLSFAAWACTVTMGLATIWYCHLIVKGTITPTSATWIIGTLAAGLGFAAYWGTPDRSLGGNVTNLTGIVQSAVILLFVLVASAARGGSLVAFSRFQWWCLTISALIALYLVLPFTSDLATRASQSFWGLQIITSVAYVVMVAKLWKTRENTDSVVMWLLLAAASFFGLIAGVEKHDVYGIVNSARAVLSTFGLAGLMWYFDARRVGRRVAS